MSDNEQVSQDDVDSMFDSEPKAGMDLNEIDEPEALRNKDEQEFDIGQPMAGDVSAIYDIPVQISVVLGRSTMQVSQLLKLGRGAVVELDRKVGEAIDIYVNNRLVARGEVVVVDDKLGVTMTEIVKSDRA
ncbi:MAG: flagellar motor switch protein FliN [Alphaproteobacteria bacterium]|nr:flagellar motor switch protein FliN [Alphaproteobacteria bacterium]MCB9974115.1 flagellar motor switch protein FliN [Rhodospirillales bacterium]